MKTKFITTSIAYINAEPHIGFLLELISADIIKRIYLQKGENAFLLTGTDEHGTKVAQAAKKAGLEPKEYADKISAKYRELGEKFDVDFDYFVRTTDKVHEDFVKETWLKLKEAKLLEKRKYTGYYCTGCEAFKTERELKDGKCLIHEIEAEKTEEENWFLLLSKLTAPYWDWFVKTSGIIEPLGRWHELHELVEENLENKGLDDVSVSRPKEKVSWGIPVPGDDSQVIYVWAEALLNYLSAIKAAGKELRELWPADFQIIGKDILRFHALVWPAMLIGLGIEPPKKILVHGFVNVDGKKMSKSLGNVITPDQLLERYGAEATRYLLFRQLSFEEDSNFVWKDVDSIYNGELANGLGNLVARVIGLINGFKLEKAAKQKVVSGWLEEEKKLKTDLYDDVELTFNLSAPLSLVNDYIVAADSWLTSNHPWTWEKEGGVDGVKIKYLLESTELYKIAWVLEPYLPRTSRAIIDQLTSLEPKSLFPRLQLKKV